LDSAGDGGQGERLGAPLRYETLTVGIEPDAQLLRTSVRS
jgi:hypothetical protein